MGASSWRVRPGVVRLVAWPAFVLVFIAIALCGSARWRFFSASSFPPGADGYYYAAQLRHHAERGEFFGADRSLALHLLRLSAGAREDPVRATQWVATIVSMMLIVAAFLAARSFLNRTFQWQPEVIRLRCKYVSGALAASAVAACSAGLFLSLEYWKQLLGAVFFLFFLAALFSENRWRHLAAIVFALAAVWSHRSFVVFVLLALTPPLALWYWHEMRQPRFKKWLLPAIVLTAVGIVALALFVWRQAARIQEGFSEQIVFAPIEYVRTARTSILGQFEAWFVFVTVPAVLLCCALAEFRARLQCAWPLASLALVALCAQSPFFTFENLGLGFRLYLVAHLAAAMLLAALFIGMPRVIPAMITTGLFLLIPAVTASFRLPTRTQAAKLEEVVAAIRLPDDALVVAHQPLDNVYYLRTGKDAFRYEPGAQFGDRPIWRVAHGLKGPGYRQCLAGAAYVALPHRYSLFAEDDWQRFRACLAPVMLRNIDRNWRNVSRTKPGFLD